jgi:anti-sigma regulatory factor (Ser/Thr protein kinase)
VAAPTVGKVSALTHQELVAEPASPSRVRRALRSWLARLPMTDDDRDDLVLAVSEAVANAVDHAYTGMAEPGGIAVRAAVEGRPDATCRVVVAVADAGRWRPAPSQPGYRGRGLRLMRACTGEMQVTVNEAGTQVLLVSRPF